MDDRERMKNILRRYFSEADELTIEGAMQEIGEIIDDLIEEIHDRWMEQED